RLRRCDRRAGRRDRRRRGRRRGRAARVGGGGRTARDRARRERAEVARAAAAGRARPRHLRLAREARRARRSVRGWCGRGRELTASLSLLGIRDWGFGIRSARRHAVCRSQRTKARRKTKSTKKNSLYKIQSFAMTLAVRRAALTIVAGLAIIS